jgi:hypothetical protein
MGDHIEVKFTDLEARALLAGLNIALHGSDSELDKKTMMAMKRGTAKLEYAEMRFGAKKWLKRHGLICPEQ